MKISAPTRGITQEVDQAQVCNETSLMSISEIVYYSVKGQ